MSSTNDISIFAFDDYKLFLKARIDAEKSWGQVTKLAEAARCQRSYLSRVLNDNIHLTPDHAYGIARFWQLNDAETEFLLTLLEQARAVSHSYREHLGFRLKSLRREQENIAKRLKRARIEPGEKELSYYSAWYWGAIHIAVSIPSLQTVDALAKHFSLPKETVRFVLENLERFSLIKQEEGRWKFASGELHIPKESLLVGLHHNNWRQRAMLHVQTPNHDGIHYTMVQSMSESVVEQIKHKILNLIDETVALAGPSKSEELICINCDFFRT